jgi:UDPglucose 6-dehydrogenase
MRDSAALKAVESFLARGVASIHAYDPLAMNEARNRWFNPDKNHLFNRISYYESAEEAIRGSHALYISTDWEEFRGLSHLIESAVKPPYLIIDGRRMIPDFEALVAKGYTYLPVGGTLLTPEAYKARSGNGAVSVQDVEALEKA